MAIVLHDVMNKVERIYFLRKFAAPLAFFLTATAVLLSTVSVSHVIANMPAFIDLRAVVQFFAAAFAHTHAVVQFALVAGIAFLLWTLKGLVDSVRFTASMVRTS
jgi:hypothetical protein